MPNKGLRALICYLVLLNLASCKSESEMTEKQVEEIKHIHIKEMGSEVKLPSKIWYLIEGIGLGTGSQAAPATKKDDLVGSLSAGSMNFAPIKVNLREKTKGILVNGPQVFIELPVGGGDIDLSQYLKKKQGTFYVSFDFEGDSDLVNSRVYFVSRAKKRRIDDEIYGMGCRKFVDISNYYFKSIKNGQFAVNTTRNRHLTVLGGTFVFALKNKTQYRVTQVTFKDSLQPEYFCDQTGASEKTEGE